MRNLTIIRERALFCFGVPYYCVLDCTKEELTAAAEEVGYPAVLNHPVLAAAPINNGMKIVVEIPDEAVSFDIAVYRESKPLVAEAVEVPAGTEDVAYVIHTDYDGGNRIALYVLPA